MSYVNRFTFKHSIGFRLLERGYPYLQKIKKIEIDGNLVHAVIHGTYDYDVTALINFNERILSFPKCSCPYKQEHRHCKHLGAIVLYLDLYLNGGSVYELENYIISEVAFSILINLYKYSIKLTGETILKAMVGKNLFSFGYDFGHIMYLSDTFSKLSEKRVIEAIRMLERMKCIKIHRDETITLLRDTLPERGYYSFFAKYSFLEGHEDNEEDDEERGFFDDEYDRDYFYGKQQEEVSGGINVTVEFPLVEKFCNIKGFLDIENKIILDEFEYEDLGKVAPYDYIELPKYELSNKIIEYIIGELPEGSTKNEVIQLYEDNELNYDNFIEYLTPNLKSKFRNIVENYYIGKLSEFCLENNIHFYFPRPYGSNEYDYMY